MSTALPYERSKINREPSEGKERKWSKFLLSCSSSLGFVGTCQRLIQPHLKAEIITMYLLTESSVRQLSAMNVLETWLSLLLFPITVISYNNFIFIIPWQSSKGIWSTLSTIKCYINDSYYNKTVFFFFRFSFFVVLHKCRISVPSWNSIKVKPVPSATEERSLNHYIARKVSQNYVY